MAKFYLQNKKDDEPAADSYPKAPEYPQSECRAILPTLPSLDSATNVLKEPETNESQQISELRFSSRIIKFGTGTSYISVPRLLVRQNNLMTKQPVEVLLLFRRQEGATTKT